MISRVEKNQSLNTQQDIISNKKLKFATRELIYQRAPSHPLSNAKTLTLHQQDLDYVGNLVHQLCPKIETLYLQGNYIAEYRKTFVFKLKYLKYLNIAINKFSSIPYGLGKCERLEKLDCTANQITDLLSISNLKNCRNLVKLILTGNLCCNYPKYREYCIFILPQMEWLDSVKVTDIERENSLKLFSSPKTIDFYQKMYKDEMIKLKNTASSIQQSYDELKTLTPQAQSSLNNKPQSPKGNVDPLKYQVNKANWKFDIKYVSRGISPQLRHYLKSNQLLDLSETGFDLSKETQCIHMLLFVSIGKYQNIEQLNLTAQTKQIQIQDSIGKIDLFRLFLDYEILLSFTETLFHSVTGILEIDCIVWPKYWKKLKYDAESSNVE